MSELMPVNTGAAGAVVSMLTVALLALSAPCQFVARTGVTVYLQDPFGTPVSTQEVAARVPAHAEQDRLGGQVAASYRFTR